MTDERQGKPSASGFERLMLCPGSWQAEKGMPDTPSAISERGNRIHEWLAGDETHLSDDEQAIADACLLDRSAITGPISTSDIEKIERRYWLTGTVPYAELLSGKADYILYRNNEAFIIDYKTGYADVIEAERNPQLMALAVIIDQNFGPLDKITVAIVQPPHRPSVAVYDRQALKVATSVIIQALEHANDPKAKRIPGEKQCKYCKAKLVCDAAWKQAESTTLTATIEGAIYKLDSVELGRRMTLLKFAVKLAEDYEAEVKRRLKDGVEVPGWHLGKPKMRETIKDLGLLFQRLQARFEIRPAVFAGACTITKKALREMFKANSVLKGKQLDQEIETALDGLTESKPCEASLEQD